ncbi:box C/D snoRNA protein 1 [Nasonia vitripennis]|uniref:Box C/D snoRNA protein 1 n=1 Tax=Nasonia vitripennis TaxID=7425 RepID=A0A7M7LUW8_NASVI|nr:box C/D snoRNA protein 1 [Nasonia vitripennis]
MKTDDRMTSTSEKLETCEVCAANKAKYTCPKCEVRTCSLTCANIHKQELECDGIRDKTKFIPLNSFTDLDLLSDYRLLENIGRSVEQLQKDPAKRCTRLIEQNLPPHFYRLRAAAYRKGVELHFMPHNFSRHIENTTHLEWKTNEIFWRVELIFSQAENAKWVIERVPENKRLSILLEEILNGEGSTETKSSDASSHLSVLQNKLKFYRACGLSGLKAFLKAERVKKSDSRFFDLDLDMTLQENLNNKTIIEFPIIYVALKDHSDMFEIIDSDDEELKEKAERHSNRRNKLNRKRKQMDDQENSPKIDVDSSVNYFFNGDISDSEDELSCPSLERKRYKNNEELYIPDYNELVKMQQ